MREFAQNAINQNTWMPQKSQDNMCIFILFHLKMLFFCFLWFSSGTKNSVHAQKNLHSFEKLNIAMKFKWNINKNTYS